MQISLRVLKFAVAKAQVDLNHVAPYLREEFEERLADETQQRVQLGEIMEQMEAETRQQFDVAEAAVQQLAAGLQQVAQRQLHHEADTASLAEVAAQIGDQARALAGLRMEFSLRIDQGLQRVTAANAAASSSSSVSEELLFAVLQRLTAVEQRVETQDQAV